MHLIRAALESGCAPVHVFVAFKPGEEPPGELRAAWVQHEFRNDAAVVVHAKQDVWYRDADSQLWADITTEWLDGRAPDVVFTSEAYGDAWASSFPGNHTKHVCVDAARAIAPVSGTLVRADPAACWRFLSPPVRSWYSRVFVLVGPESTGKSTLTSLLAARFGGASTVPEVGRELTDLKIKEQNLAAMQEEKGCVSVEWTSDDFVWVAREQAARIARARAESRVPLVFSDCDALAAMVWHERYMGFSDERVERVFEEEQDNRNLVYLLATPAGAPHVQDGTRDGTEDIRNAMFARFVDLLVQKRQRFFVVSGDSWGEREACAVGIVERELRPVHESDVEVDVDVGADTES